MKVLFITSDYYPSRGSCGILINRILFEGGLADKCGEVTVLCGKESFYNSDEEYYRTVRAVRGNTWSYYRVNELRKIARTNVFSAAVGVFMKAHKLIRRTFFRKYCYDPLVIRALLRASKRISSADYDVIVPLTGRYECGVVALRLSKKHGKPIVLYQLDPCSTYALEPEESIPYRKKFEKKLFSSVSSVVSLPEIYRDARTYLEPSFLDKFTVAGLPMIIRPEKTMKKKDDEKTVCMFSGCIHPVIREPSYTLRLFEKIIGDDISLHLVGVEEWGLPPSFSSMGVICHGRLPFEEARRLLEECADILVNIGNNCTNQIPSKIFDYMSTGKPVVNICKKRDCPTLFYFEKYPLSINLFEEEDLFDEQVLSLKKFISEMKGRTVDFDYVEKTYALDTPLSVSSVIYEKLTEAVGEEKKR